MGLQMRPSGSRYFLWSYFTAVPSTHIPVIMSSCSTGHLPASLPAPPPPDTEQYYKRPLPPSGISFSSAQGKHIFRQALAAGYMEGYFGLAAQFCTQAEPAYCGLSSLVMVLNTLGVDPQRMWKGVWRWYQEDMLDSCVPLHRAVQVGITMEEFSCIARSNALRVNMVRATQEASEEQFRAEVKKLTRCTDEVLIVSYSRAVLDQTGDGHFSPVGGYHPEQDLVLVLDTARFKYPPHWVSLPLLFKAMQECDEETGLSRGYISLRKSDTIQPILPPLGLSVARPMLNSKHNPSGLSQFMGEWRQRLLRSSYLPDFDILQTAVEAFNDIKCYLLGDYY